MKKAHNLNNTKKLTLNKLKVAKLENLYTIKGGQSNIGEDDGGDDSLTWPIGQLIEIYE